VGSNLRLLLLHRELPLELLAGLGVVIAVLRRDAAIIMPVAWLVASVLAVLFYHPLFPHHLVMLSLALALVAAVGIQAGRQVPPPAPSPQGGGSRKRELLVLGIGLVLVLPTAGAGAVVAVRDIQLALVPDQHNAEMVAAIRAVGRPGDYWISDNPYAVAAADRDIPGPLVDTSGQRTRAGLLTVADLEAARVRYRVGWVLVDSFRLDAVPGFRGWLGQHFHAVENLGGRAVIYQLDKSP
jgi:hypothetical protein